MVLRIDVNTTIFASTAIDEHYFAIEPLPSYTGRREPGGLRYIPFIFGHKVTNVIIEGNGMINGQVSSRSYGWTAFYIMWRKFLSLTIPHVITHIYRVLFGGKSMVTCLTRDHSLLNSTSPHILPFEVFHCAMPCFGRCIQCIVTTSQLQILPL